MSVKISELTAANALTGAEEVALVQSGSTKKVTVNDLLPVQLQEDKTIDLDGHELNFNDGVNPFITIDASNRVLTLSGNDGDNKITTGLDPQTGLASNLTIAGGDPVSNTDVGANIYIRAGFGGSVSGDGGALLMESGAVSGVDGNGGLLEFISQSGGATSGNGGDIQFTTGSAQGAGDGGVVLLVAGNGGLTSGDGGYVHITSGSGRGGDGNAGDITITAGTGNGIGNDGTITYTADTHTINGAIITPDLLALDFADDAAAAAGSVAVGQWYHTSGALKIRLA